MTRAHRLQLKRSKSEYLQAFAKEVDKLMYIDVFECWQKAGQTKQWKSDLLRKWRVQHRDAGANHNSGGPLYWLILARLYIH